MASGGAASPARLQMIADVIKSMGIDEHDRGVLDQSMNSVLTICDETLTIRQRTKALTSQLFSSV